MQGCMICLAPGHAQRHTVMVVVVVVVIRAHQGVYMCMGHKPLPDCGIHACSSPSSSQHKPLVLCTGTRHQCGQISLVELGMSQHSCQNCALQIWRFELMTTWGQSALSHCASPSNLLNQALLTGGGGGVRNQNWVLGI